MEDRAFTTDMARRLMVLLRRQEETGYLPGDAPLLEYVNRCFILVGWTVDRGMSPHDILDEVRRIRSLFGRTGVCLSAIASVIGGQSQPLLRLQFDDGITTHCYLCDVLEGDAE